MAIGCDGSESEGCVIVPIVRTETWWQWGVLRGWLEVWEVWVECQLIPGGGSKSLSWFLEGVEADFIL